MLVEEHIRDAVDAGVEAVGTSGLLEFQEISYAAKRRDRQRRGLGGLATVLVACLAFVSVGALRGGPDTTAVFAADPNVPATPALVIRSGDGYVGMSPVNAFELDDLGNATTEFVMSADGVAWERVLEARPMVGLGFRLTERDGVFYLVASRVVDTASVIEPATATQGDERDVEDQSHEAEYFLATSTDLVSWQEVVFDISDELVQEGHSIFPTGIDVIDGSAVVLFQRVPSSLSVQDGLEALGFDWESVCDHRGSESSARIRICGQTERIVLPRDSDTRWSFSFFALRIDSDRDGVEEIVLPNINEIADSLGSQPVLYRTPNGIGVSGYKAFETTNGVDWQIVETKRDVRLMMGVRGDERVYRSNFTVSRFSENDIAVGLAYSADDAETWTPTSVDELFEGASTQPSWFSYLKASEAGWAFVVQRNLLEQPEVDGVEIESPGGLASYTITTQAGYVLSGTLPYGEARLLDPDGRLVRSWDILEPSNPQWSGLEVRNGDVLALDDDEIVARFTSAQWAALLDPPGADLYDIVFSSNGLDWSIIDSGTAMPRILAMGEQELIVQRWQPGLFSRSIPPVDVIDLPQPDN